MTIFGKTLLAVVPARGGSKSIPKKNLTVLAGRTLIAHAAGVCAALPWIDQAVLSTDDKEIAVEGRKVGLEVPFMRPAEFSGDLSTSVDMWRHAWLASEEAFAMRFDVAILLEPTSPMRRPDDVEATVRTLLEGEYPAVCTISRMPGHFTPQKTLTIDDEGRIGFYLQTGSSYSLRQTIPPYYYRNGICYAVRRETLIERGVIMDETCHAIVIERDVVNIDDPIDLKFAEFLFSRT
jgi:CMP-N,N'-diacetyllegionaminic acid synthase